MRLDFKKRVERLEAQLSEKETVVDEQAEREAAKRAVYEAKVDAYFRACDQLAAQLPEELFDRVAEEAQREGTAQMMMGFHSSACSIQSPLLFAVCSIADHHCRNAQHGTEHGTSPIPPLAIPESMARWFAEYGSEAVAPIGTKPKFYFDFNAADCEDCGFRVPIDRNGYDAQKEKHKAQHRKGIPSAAFPFPRCPVCNGVTGVLAWITKHGANFSQGRVSYGEWVEGKEKPY